MRASQARKNQYVYRALSADGRCQSQSMFECYCLEHHSNDPYSLFLKELKSETPVAEAGSEVLSVHHNTRELMTPSEEVLVSWIQHLHDGDVDMTAAVGEDLETVRGRQNKGSSIETKLKNLSGVLMEFGQPKLSKSGHLNQMVKDWKNEDERCPAEGFDMADVLPKLYDILFSEQYKMTEPKKIEVWARLMLQLCIIGRSSDVTEYCPSNGSIRFPDDPRGYFEDGSPMWVEVSMTDWKCRQPDKKGQRYKLRICANTRDCRFCAVHSLCEHWMVRGRKGAGDDEPILPKIASATWRRHLRKLFGMVGLVCTSHSIRHTAAQWAARCGAPLYIVKNVGRWATIKCMLNYMADGVDEHTTAMRDYGEDKLKEWYPFNANTMVSRIEMTQGHAEGALL